MSVKDNVLKILENNKGQHFSGEEIAKELDVSRSAVWKAVKTLTKEGYNIVGINNKGYCMLENSDVITREEINKNLNKELRDKADIEVYKTITSTNAVLKKMASEGAKEWKILVAEEQTNGRGRLNRNFYSPSNSGIYMSILLKPEVISTEALFITTMAAVAVSEAIEKLTNVKTEIKWVNDVYCNGKKVCGILTEASLNVENGKLDYAVLGIGINLKTPKDEFPEDIRNIAAGFMDGAEYEIENLRSRITSEVLSNIYKYYKHLEKHKFMDKYKEKSMLIGKYVYIKDKEPKEQLLVKDIDDNTAALVVEHSDGRIEKLSTGEVSVRPMD